MEQQEFKYFAFISYSSKDMAWGKQVHKKLEYYRMPSTLCSEHGWKRKPMNPIFFAPYEIQPGGLTEELQERLKASKNLIVICSPNSAKSTWVGKEIEFFHGLGRANQIHFFIVDGKPNSGSADTECYNPIINTLGMPEILGANIHEKIYRWPWMNKERAYVQLISKLLGVEFNAIWQRHKRLLIQRSVSWAIGIVAVLAALLGVWNTSRSVDVEMRLNEVSVHNENLPPLKDAVVTLILDNETKTDTICSLDAAAVFTNIPHRFLNHEVRIQMEALDHLPVDTMLLLTKSVSLDIRRNPAVYGQVHFQLWNPDANQTSKHSELQIDGLQVQSDAGGFVTLTIPLEQQKTVYPVTSRALHLVDTVVHPPFGPNDIVQFQ